MTTRPAGSATYFLPFNRGLDGAAGNPPVVAYIISPDFLRIIRAGCAGFRHRCCRAL